MPNILEADRQSGLSGKTKFYQVPLPSHRPPPLTHADHGPESHLSAPPPASHAATGPRLTAPAPRPCPRPRQASTSELYGKMQEPRHSETPPFYPRSPYACAKLMGFWCVVKDREVYSMFAVNGILESPRPGETFVTRKITRAPPPSSASTNYSARDCGHV
jgi:hypothetical protein